MANKNPGKLEKNRSTEGQQGDRVWNGSFQRSGLTGPDRPEIRRMDITFK